MKTRLSLTTSLCVEKHCTLCRVHANSHPWWFPQRSTFLAKQTCDRGFSRPWAAILCLSSPTHSLVCFFVCASSGNFSWQSHMRWWQYRTEWWGPAALLNLLQLWFCCITGWVSEVWCSCQHICIAATLPLLLFLLVCNSNTTRGWCGEQLHLWAIAWKIQLMHEASHFCLIDWEKPPL